MAIQTLRCPHCSAPLTRDAEGKDPTECPYCHSALTSNKPIVIVNGPGAAQPTKPVGLFVGAAVVGLVAVIGGVLFLVPSGTKSTSPVEPVVVKTVAPPEPPAPVKPPEPPSPLKEVFRFGQAGENPGQISHGNHLALAPDGSFFIGETSTGRLQKFDAEGKYVDGLVLPVDRLTKQNGLHGMVGDAKGHVYVNRQYDVLVYDAATMKLVRELAGNYPDRAYHGGLAVDAEGNVLALADRMGEMSMFKLSSTGKVLGHQKTYATDVSVDGTGKLFLLSGQGLEVRDPKGDVLSKVGVKGDRVAYDGNGHVYVLTTSNVIEVVGVDGAKLASLPVMSANDLAIDAKGRLVTLQSDHVIVWEVTLP